MRAGLIEELMDEGMEAMVWLSSEGIFSGRIDPVSHKDGPEMEEEATWMALSVMNWPELAHVFARVAGNG